MQHLLGRATLLRAAVGFLLCFLLIEPCQADLNDVLNAVSDLSNRIDMCNRNLYFLNTLHLSSEEAGPLHTLVQNWEQAEMGFAKDYQAWLNDCVDDWRFKPMENNEMLETLERMQTFGLSFIRNVSVAFEERTFEIYSGQTDDTFDHMTERDVRPLSTPKILIERVRNVIVDEANEAQLHGLNMSSAQGVVVMSGSWVLVKEIFSFPLDVKKSGLSVDSEGTLYVLLRRSGDLRDNEPAAVHISIPAAGTAFPVRKVLNGDVVAKLDGPPNPFVYLLLCDPASFTIHKRDLPSAVTTITMPTLQHSSRVLSKVPYSIRFENQADAKESEVRQYSWAVRNDGGTGFIHTFDKKRAAELRDQRDKLETALAEYVPRVCTYMIGKIATIRHTDYIIGIPKVHFAETSFLTLTIAAKADGMPVDTHAVQKEFHLSEAYYGQVNGKRVLYFAEKEEHLNKAAVIAVEIDVLEVES
eukprot:GHVS01002664.1.p1 GENE.GHVS01002664.1~~GHVS01002664.1.p1  ORF type:complete len:471 (-),score=24.89 GHVS01002664.1:15-1427(-)